MSADFRALGVAVGHATDSDGATGVTVVRGVDGPLRAGAAVFGRAAGTRELHTLAVDHLVDRIDALMLTGGSAYGLDAAAGVMRWMEERGRGFAVPGGVVPIVPAAVIFDLVPLGRFDARPSERMAYDACDAASPNEIAEGSVGAGTGATVGKIAGPTRAMKGGLGCAVESNGSWRVAAIAVVNALGDVRDADGRIIAGARVEEKSATPFAFMDAARQLVTSATAADARVGARLGAAAANTTLCVVATDAPLGRVELTQLARAAGAALFRRITPTGTTVDGDVVFALGPALPPLPLGNATTVIEAIAVAALESAIERAVRTARGRDGVPGLAD
ncbi:MAG TPA: P1 family peptidase [Gemmatimonadaceae bacterium]|nr:P1 family peptidase [Gemmatimonadaceae bacterium]